MFRAAMVSLALLASHAGQVLAQIDSLEERSQFIFKGTVLRVGATTLAELAPDSRTVVVRVDEALKAPPAANYVRRDITLYLADSAAVKPGDQFIFFTVSWIFGSDLAVREVARSADSGGVRTELSKALAQAADRPLRARLASAEAVIRARVTAARAASEKIRGGPLTEHDPDWWEADLEVLSVEKGNVTDRKLTVLFANSTDILWERSPKLRPGQEAIVLLRKEQASGRPTFGAYIALEELDLRPVGELARIRSLVK